MPLNIVCLHGFTQNSEIIKKKLSRLIKANDKINLYYLDGSVVLGLVDKPETQGKTNMGSVVLGLVDKPETQGKANMDSVVLGLVNKAKIHKETRTDTIEPPSEPGSLMRAYWIVSLENPLVINWMDHYLRETVLYHLDDSFESFITFGKKIGGVDGIIGFSQGGCFVDYICKLHAINRVPFDIKFAIFISAKTFNRIGWECNNVVPSIDTLHIYGTNDAIIPPTQSENLSTMYINKEILNHKGSHVVPSTSAAKIAVKNFLAKFTD